MATTAHSRPAGTLRLLARGLAVALLAVLARSPAAQGEDELARARQAVQAFDAARRAADELRGVLEDARAELVALPALVAGPVPEPPPPLERLAPGDLGVLLAEIELRRDFLAALEARVRAVAGGPDLVARAREASDASAEAEKALRQTAAQARTALTALAAGAQVGTEPDLGADGTAADWLVRAREVPAPQDPPSPLADEVASAARAAAAALEGARSPPPELLATARVEALAGEVIQGMARSAAATVERLRAEDPAHVEAGLDAAGEEYRATLQRLEQTLASLNEARAVHAAAARAVGELAAPRRADFQGEGETEEVREADGRLRHAEAMVAFRARALELVEAERAASETLAARLEASSDVFERHAEATLRLAAHRRALLELVEAGTLPARATPPDMELERLWPELLRFALDEARRLDESAALARILAEDPVAAAAATLEQVREQARVAAEVLTTARELSSVHSEVRALSDADLLAALAPGGSAVVALEDARAREDEARAAYDERHLAAWRPRTSIEDLDHPYSVTEVRRYPGRVEELRRQLEAYATDPQAKLPLDRSVDLPREEALHREVSAAGLPPAGSEQLGPAPLEIQYLGNEEQQARERLIYFDELGELVARRTAEHAALEAAGERLLAALGATHEALRRRQACLRELEARVASGAIPAADVPEAARAEGPDPREQAARVEEFRRTFQRERAAVGKRLGDVEVLLEWRRWAELGGKKAKQKVDTISLPLKHVQSADRTVEELRDYERRTLEFEAGQLRARRTSMVDRALGTIASDEVRARYEEPLAAYCLEVVNLERSRAEFGLAAAAYQDLIDLTLSHREELAGAMESLQRAEQVLWRRYQVVRHLAAAAMNPRRRADVAGSFNELCGEPLPPGVGLPSGGDALQWANVLLGAEGALWGGRRWVAVLEHRMSRLGFDAEVNRYRAHKTRIEAEADSRGELARGIEDDVTELLAEYSAELRRHAGFVAARVLLIPFLALLLTRLVRRLVLRLQTRSIQGVDHEERQRRVRTLSNVAIATTTVTIWIIAGIYVLAGLGLDVTPIVASASVAGLALAFGAQSLVKDYFAGFCILTENQYTVGDIVDIGSASGTVEHITLRVTVLRDIEGVVHYVPNGEIQRVSNKTKGWSRVVLEVAVAYGQDVDRVLAVLREVVEAMKADPPWDEVLLEPPEVAGVEQMTESAVSVRVMAKTQPGKQWVAAREMRRRIRMRLDAEGIRAPFPHRMIYQVEGEGREASGAGT